MSKKYISNSIKGFSLVELSVVVVIIGLLVAGITFGAELIAISKVNSVISDFHRYHSAYNNFRATYQEKPGDFSEGATYCTDSSSGDRDGVIEFNPTAAADEANQAWYHMSKAGLIPDSISERDSDSTAYTAGIHAPGSQVDGAAFHLSGTAPTGVTLEHSGSNALHLAKPGTAAQGLGAPSVSPAFAASLDKKVDDGTPGQGSIRSAKGTSTTDGCVSGDAYNVTDQDEECVVSYKLDN